jgi:hypothetical protein
MPHTAATPGLARPLNPEKASAGVSRACRRKHLTVHLRDAQVRQRGEVQLGEDSPAPVPVLLESVALSGTALPADPSDTCRTIEQACRARIAHGLGIPVLTPLAIVRDKYGGEACPPCVVYPAVEPSPASRLCQGQLHKYAPHAQAGIVVWLLDLVTHCHERGITLGSVTLQHVQLRNGKLYWKMSSRSRMCFEPPEGPPGALPLSPTTPFRPLARPALETPEARGRAPPATHDTLPLGPTPRRYLNDSPLLSEVSDAIACLPPPPSFESPLHLFGDDSDDGVFAPVGVPPSSSEADPSIPEMPLSLTPEVHHRASIRPRSAMSDGSDGDLSSRGSIADGPSSPHPKRMQPLPGSFEPDTQTGPSAANSSSQSVESPAPHSSWSCSMARVASQVRELRHEARVSDLINMYWMAASQESTSFEEHVAHRERVRADTESLAQVALNLLGMSAPPAEGKTLPMVDVRTEQGIVQLRQEWSKCLRAASAMEMEWRALFDEVTALVRGAPVALVRSRVRRLTATKGLSCSRRLFEALSAPVSGQHAPVSGQHAPAASAPPPVKFPSSHLPSTSVPTPRLPSVAAPLPSTSGHLPPVTVPIPQPPSTSGHLPPVTVPIPQPPSTSGHLPPVTVPFPQPPSTSGHLPPVTVPIPSKLGHSSPVTAHQLPPVTAPSTLGPHGHYHELVAPPMPSYPPPPVLVAPHPYSTCSVLPTPPAQLRSPVHGWPMGTEGPSPHTGTPHLPWPQ